MITADVNRSDLSKMAESMLVNIHGDVTTMPIFFAKSGSELVILGHPLETYARKCERNLHDGGCEIAFSGVDGSHPVAFVANFLQDRRDRSASSLGNIYSTIK